MSTLIKTPFGFHSTADEVSEGVELTGKRAVVTGAASGIGVETARTLARRGADVTLAVRDISAGQEVASDIVTSTGNSAVHVEQLDLADLASVRSFAERWSGPLHILVNNAGIMATPEQRTVSGWEIQFATNHVGHFALAVWLHDALARAGNARIVSVSSSAHMLSPVIFDDLHFRFRAYDPRLAYGQAKTANVLFAVAATQSWASDGITANSLMPGAIKTKLQQYVGGIKAPPEVWKTTQQGASTSVLLATSPLLEGIGGRYFVNNNEAEIVDGRTSDMTGVAPYALDSANADRLWDVTMDLISR